MQMNHQAEFRPSPSGARFLGHGVGLRREHFERILSGPTRVDWFEAISENFMVAGGRALDVLTRVRERYPIVLHGVSLSIGSTDPLDRRYLDELAALARRFAPEWVSDHLCWTGVGGHNTHDLVPLPYTTESVEHVAERVRTVQEHLGRRIALENVSSYLSYTADAMPEWEFLTAIAENADCGILLDVNNIFVSAHNHGFAAAEYIDGIPPERVFQIHLAGHSESGPLLIDTHDHPVRDEVWELYAQALGRTGPVSTLIEWDDRIPPYSELLAEVGRAREVLEKVWPVERAAARTAETTK